MTVNVASVGVKTFAVCAAVLYTKFFIITRIQAVKKYDAGTCPPEDTFLPPREHIPQGYGLVETKDKAVLKAREEEQRWNHIVMNDIEALPLGMFVFAGALAVGVKESVTIPSMIVFTASRCIYSVAYAKALQPHRFIFYGFAVLSVFVTSGNIVSTVFF
ncbi:hypothetical protein Poli38472_001074 [Pythium oligandrum]|uniref:Microsomal glutathione S-transferase 1 n=1 Tax=Pythium oligandrum TaxID=41045 RepID=A0A8K1CVA9_PYTOL|nr:hypothetical protein Poli38472_001074 [Pythium oligandrum]|eukprot:TMW68918.1 hypothetical protein Poli38472_001074 [Pythium oligandrum]